MPWGVDDTLRLVAAKEPTAAGACMELAVRDEEPLLTKDGGLPVEAMTDSNIEDGDLLGRRRLRKPNPREHEIPVTTRVYDTVSGTFLVGKPLSHVGGATEQLAHSVVGLFVRLRDSVSRCSWTLVGLGGSGQS